MADLILDTQKPRCMAWKPSQMICSDRADLLETQRGLSPDNASSVNNMCSDHLSSFTPVYYSEQKQQDALCLRRSISTGEIGAASVVYVED